MLFRRWVLTFASILVVPALVATASPAIARDAIATSTSVVVSPVRPGQLHVVIALSAADGTVPAGTISVRGWAGNLLASIPVSGPVTELDVSAADAGDGVLGMFDPADVSAYAPSGGGSNVPDVTPSLTITNPGVGAVRVEARVAGFSSSDGTIVFVVGGQAPVTVPLGEWAVVGSPKFDQDQYSWMRPDLDVARIDVPGLDPIGTVDVTAAYVPAGGDPADGFRSSRTTTLSRTKVPFLFSAEPAKRGVFFDMGVVAYPVGEDLGRIAVFDAKTGKRLAWGIWAISRVADGFIISGARLKTGTYRFRAVFTPRKELRDTLSRTVVLTPRVTVKG